MDRHRPVLWREGVTAFGTADDGGLFFSERSGIISCTTKCLYDRQSINNMNA